MIAVLQSNMAFMKTGTFAVALVLGHAMVAAPAPIARSEPAHSDTLIAVSADVRLRVIDAGPSNAQSIVLIPGWCFTADIWSKQIAALSDRYHVVGSIRARKVVQRFSITRIVRMIVPRTSQV